MMKKVFGLSTISLLAHAAFTVELSCQLKDVDVDATSAEIYWVVNISTVVLGDWITMTGASSGLVGHLFD